MTTQKLNNPELQKMVEDSIKFLEDESPDTSNMQELEADYDFFFGREQSRESAYTKVIKTITALRDEVARLESMGWSCGSCGKHIYELPCAYCEDGSWAREEENSNDDTE